MNDSTAAQSVAVIGGGITGLAAAHRLLQRDPRLKIALYEASNRLGGVLATTREGDFLIEHGPDMFITREPWAIDLCRQIGFEKELISTRDVMRRAMIVRRGKLVPVPEGFTLMAPARIGPILATGLLSPWGKLRLGWELFVPARRDMADESLADFARRRFGNEVYQRMIQPLVGGIYTADPEQLSMQAAMPRFVEMERKWGSLAKAMRRQKATSAASGARSEHVHGVRYESFVAPREGIETLVTAIAKRLPAESIRRNTTVERLDRRADGTWSVVTSGPEALPPSDYRGVILALPAGAAAKLTTPLDQELGAELKAITYAGASVVVLAYRRRDIAHPLDGFGAVVPQIERRKILAISFASNKFVDRAPADCILLRVFVGGALQGELMQLDDSEMLSLVEGELRELIGVRGDPVLRKVVRWNGAMPQYHVGHMDRVARIEARAAMLPGLELAGNAYHGVGIPYCVHSGERAAERILQSLPMALPV